MGRVIEGSWSACKGAGGQTNASGMGAPRGRTEAGGVHGLSCEGGRAGVCLRGALVPLPFSRCFNVRFGRGDDIFQ